MKTTCLIVGLGQIGMQYDINEASNKIIHTHSKAFSTHPRFKLIGAVDTDISKCNEFSQKFKLPAHSEISSCFGEESPDLVIISLPTERHFESIKEIISLCKPKVILCEKPLSYSLKESKSILDLCKKNHIALFVNYMRRSDPGVLEIKKRIKLKDISYPMTGVVWYSGGFLNNGSHFFNLLEFFLGHFCDAEVISKPFDMKNGDFGINAQVNFKNGKIYFLNLLDNSFSHHTLELISSSGRLRYDEGGKKIIWQSLNNHLVAKKLKVLNSLVEIIENDLDRYQWNVANQLANYFIGKPYELCSGDDALITLKSMSQICESY